MNSRGKDICNELKAVRRRIAEENDIPLVIPECPHKGPCPGTCPQCEKELRQLESALASRLSVGKVATVAGLALALAAPAAAQARDTVPPVQQQVTVQKPDKLFKVCGTLLDSKTEEPLPFAYVIFYDNDKNRVAVGYTDFDGLFKVELPAGDYKMEIRSVGYYTFEQQVSIAKKTDLGEILIECTATMSEGIVIESDKTPLLEIDPYGNSQHLEIEGVQVNVK